MPLTLAMRNKWLNLVFNQTSFTPPTAWWVQLHWGDPGLNGTGNAWTAAGRQQVTSWTAAANKQNASATQCIWSPLPDPAPYTVVTHISIWSHSTSTDHATYSIAYGELSAPVLVANGGIITILAGDIKNLVT